MSAAFRPRFRRGAAGADSGGGRPEAGGKETEDFDGEETEAGGKETEDFDGDAMTTPVAGEETEAGEWLAYELHEWSLESRVMLQQLLTVDEVVHSWQGTTLMVHESLEAQVDHLVDEVTETETAKEAISRPIGHDEELTAFDLAEWPGALRAELIERLDQARVPHIVDTVGDGGVVAGGDERVGEDVGGDERVGEDVGGDERVGVVAGGDERVGEDVGGDERVGEDVGGDARVGVVAGGDERVGEDVGGEVCDLLVRQADEERVDLVIDDLLAREEEASFEEMDGLEFNGLLSDLFVACDRLRRAPRDADGARAAVTSARRLARVRTPFGFSASNWRSLRNAAGELLDLVESEHSDAEELRELAHRMSDTLRVLV